MTQRKYVMHIIYYTCIYLPPPYNWYIVESGVKHHNPKPLCMYLSFTENGDTHMCWRYYNQCAF
jgi:hypothetical protein